MGITSLRRRFLLLTILPLAAFLLIAGMLGFLSARAVILDQWRSAVVAELSRSAHQVDMRLEEPRHWIDMFQLASEERGGRLIQEWIIEMIRTLEGVESAEIEWNEGKEGGSIEDHMGRSGGRPGWGSQETTRFSMMRPYRNNQLKVTSPRYDTEKGKETVSLVSDLKDGSLEPSGRLVVTIRFDYLMQEVLSLGWWRDGKACLVDQDGNYLAHTSTFMRGRSRLGENGDDLELRILDEMKDLPFGAVFGKGSPPGEVACFYKIKSAPWTIILIAPGEEILAPLIRYRVYYFAGAGTAIIIVILILRLDLAKTIGAISKLSEAARKISEGVYPKSVDVHRSDELGVLAANFQAMVDGLRERDFIANTFGKYVDRDIARELLKRPEASRLGGQKRAVAIVMSDIRGFTALSQTLSPERIISFLNRYFSEMIAIIQKHRGIIVDFFGDSILFFFDPFDDALGPCIRSSLRCAREMRDSMAHLNESLKEEGFPQLNMGIGVHVGEVVVGNIGSESRAKYGIVGSPVNLTQRIQSVAGPKEIVVSDEVVKMAGEPLQTVRCFTVELKGFDASVQLHVLE